MKDREREELIERVARVKESLEKGDENRKSKTKGLKADEEENFNSTGVMRRILKLAFLNAIQRRHIRQHQKNIEVFEQAFATIKSTTGISDIDEIVKIFVALEQISKTKAATEEKDKMVKDSAEALNDCRPLIWNIVRNLKQNLPALLHAGYEGDPPPMKIATPDEHEENLNNYLMYVEEAVLQFRVSLTQDVQPLRPQPPRNRETNARPQRPAELPSAHITGDDSDDDPDTGLGDRPWTRTELRDKAQEMIKRRKRKQHGKLIGE